MLVTRSTPSQFCRRFQPAASLVRGNVVIAFLLLFLRSGQCQEQASPIVVSVATTNPNGSAIPANLFVTFSFDSVNVALSLSINKNIPTDAPVILGSGNGIFANMENQVLQNVAHYIDVVNGAAILVTATNSGSGSVIHTYSGNFKAGGSTYAIQPVQSTKRRRRRQQTPSSSGAHLITITLETMNSSATSDPQLLPPEIDMQQQMMERQDAPVQINSFGAPTTTPKPVTKPTYIVRLLAVVDFSLYQKWSMMGLPDKINQIYQYYAHIINGVDLRYRSINDTYAVNVRLVGFYIATDNSSSSFVTNNLIATSGGTVSVNAQNALFDFADWLNTNAANLPAHNQASLYTSLYMYGATGDSISGLAYYRGMCTYYSVLICKDSGDYGTTETNAHEIGHNLGCGHDGIDNTCSAADQHIMVAVPGQTTNAVYKNAYTFSSCSIGEMRLFFGNLIASTADSCLMQEPNVTVPATQIALGQIYSPDEQCVIIYGVGSYYCGGLTADSQLCRVMSCFHPQWLYCVSTYEQRAFIGTTCGDRKECSGGDCVYNASFPAGPDACIYGDTKAPFFDGSSCSSVLSQPWTCYSSSVADACCQSCSTIAASSGSPGCQYGDTQQGCGKNSDCSQPSVSASCCGTCNSLKTTTTTTASSCEQSVCSSLINYNWKCYALGQTCCETCAQYQTGITGCLYGDHVSNCTLNACSDPLKRNLCCQTCASYVPPPTTTTTTTTTTTAPTTTTTTMTTTTTKTTTTTTTPTTTTPTTTTPTTTTPTTTTTTTTTTKPTTTTTLKTILAGSQGSQGNNCQDTSTSCTSMPISNCYNAVTLQTCCNTCSHAATGISGCEYGDNNSGGFCKMVQSFLSLCSTFESYCCQTCQGL